jgi:hypothetical protein
MLPTIISATTLDDAWFQCIASCFDKTRANKYLIQKGSFEKEQSRYQLHSLTLTIDEPSVRPLTPILPEGISPLTSDENIEKYFAEYIFGGVPCSNNEVYKYSDFITPNLDFIIYTLRETPMTNQLCFNIGEANTVYKEPPCMRTLQFLVEDYKLNLVCYFRSHDLFAAAATNWGGLVLLLEYICGETNYEVGKLIEFSPGAHIYSTAVPVVEARLGKKLDW